MSCVNENNPDWSNITVAFKLALEAEEIYYSNPYYDAYDAAIRAAMGTSREYIVVSGTPSESLVNGRKEINTSTTIVDSWIYENDLTAFYIIASGNTAINRENFTQTDDDEEETTTIALPNTYGVGSIITVIFTR